MTHMQPGRIGAPALLNGPASYHSSACMAVSVPSRRAPSLMRERVADAGPEARNTSSRDMVILTGRNDFLESSSATGSR